MSEIQMQPDFLSHLTLPEDQQDEARRTCAVAMLMQCGVPPVGQNYAYADDLVAYMETGKWDKEKKHTAEIFSIAGGRDAD